VDGFVRCNRFLVIHWETWDTEQHVGEFSLIPRLCLRFHTATFHIKHKYLHTAKRNAPVNAVRFKMFSNVGLTINVYTEVLLLYIKSTCDITCKTVCLLVGSLGIIA